MPRNVDSRKLTQLLIGEWDSPRHTYVFRADGTYGVSDEQRDKWRIDGNEYIDDVSRGPIILLDRNYFIYALGQGAVVYIRANDSEAERYQSADTNTQNTAAEVNSTSNGSGDKPSDSSIKQKVLGYWSSGRHVYLVKPNGVKYHAVRHNGDPVGRQKWRVPMKMESRRISLRLPRRSFRIVPAAIGSPGTWNGSVTRKAKKFVVCFLRNRFHLPIRSLGYPTVSAIPTSAELEPRQAQSS